MAGRTLTLGAPGLTLTTNWASANIDRDSEIKNNKTKRGINDFFILVCL